MNDQQIADLRRRVAGGESVDSVAEYYLITPHEVREYLEHDDPRKPARAEKWDST